MQRSSARNRSPPSPLPQLDLALGFGSSRSHCFRLGVRATATPRSFFPSLPPVSATPASGERETERKGRGGKQTAEKRHPENPKEGSSLKHFLVRAPRKRPWADCERSIPRGTRRTFRHRLPPPLHQRRTARTTSRPLTRHCSFDGKITGATGQPVHRPPQRHTRHATAAASDDAPTGRDPPECPPERYPRRPRASRAALARPPDGPLELRAVGRRVRRPRHAHRLRTAGLAC